MKSRGRSPRTFGASRRTDVVLRPTQGASRTPPPTAVASCRFQRSRKVQFITPVTLYAASPVTLPPVRGGVPDAPRSRDCRGGLDADVRLDRLCPRFPRCARLASTAQLMRFRGHSPRTILHGRTDVVLHPRPGRRGSPPLRCSWQVSAQNLRRPSTARMAVRPSFLCSPSLAW